MKRIIIILPDEEKVTTFKQSLMALVVFVATVLAVVVLIGWLT